MLGTRKAAMLTAEKRRRVAFNVFPSSACCPIWMHGMRGVEQKFTLMIKRLVEALNGMSTYMLSQITSLLR